jgi:hypothetical protein
VRETLQHSSPTRLRLELYVNVKYLPRHNWRRDANIRTRAVNALARCGGRKRVVYEPVVGCPRDGDECGREEGEKKTGGYEEGGERRDGGV